MNPATGPHGTPRKAPAATAETTEDRLRRELAQSRLPDDALRCVCEHLAPTSPPNFEAEDVVDESQEYCDEVVCDLRTLGEEALDDITSRLDDYSLSLSVQTVLRWPYARAKDITTRRLTSQTNAEQHRPPAPADPLDERARAVDERRAVRPSAHLSNVERSPSKTGAIQTFGVARDRRVVRRPVHEQQRNVSIN